MMQISHLLAGAVASSSLHIHMLMGIGAGTLLTGRKQNLVAAGKNWQDFFGLNLHRKSSAASSGLLSKRFVRGSLSSVLIDFRSETVEMLV